MGRAGQVRFEMAGSRTLQVGRQVLNRFERNRKRQWQQIQRQRAQNLESHVLAHIDVTRVWVIVRAYATNQKRHAQ